MISSFMVHYAGACFETGDSPEQVEGKVHDRVDRLGDVLEIEATALHSDKDNPDAENYVVRFEGEMMIQAETDVEAENQAYDRLAHLGYVNTVAFKE